VYTLIVILRIFDDKVYTLNFVNHLKCTHINNITIFAKYNIKMENQTNKRGRPASGITTVDVHYKMSSDLYHALPQNIKRNTYINDAVREKMEKDGFISNKKTK